MKYQTKKLGQANVFGTEYDAVPFSRFTTLDYKPAIEEAIKESLDEIDAVSKNYKPATFENTIIPLAYSTARLDRFTAMLFNLNSAETSVNLQAQAQLVSPLLTDYHNDVYLNALLFKRVKSIYRQRDKMSLSPEQLVLIEKIHNAFLRNGAALRQRKNRLREIDRELSSLTLLFSENILNETNQYVLHITEPAMLSGIPNEVLALAEAEAQKRELKGWCFNLSAPVYLPVMKYADSRLLRRELFLAYESRCSHSNFNNNEDCLQRIASLRRERARLLGYENHAAFVLEHRMAENTDKVMNFLHTLLDEALPRAQAEITMLKNFAGNYWEEDGDKNFYMYDFYYYAEKLKQKLYNIDDQQLRPYLSLDNAVKGAFAIANKLYGIHFQEIDTIEKYNPEVQTYKVTDKDGSYLGLLYADFFPREGKRAGAWMTVFKNQYIDEDGNNSRPHVAIVCNFTRPTENTPSLLSFDMLRTLFHEFGHALHALLSNVTYPELSGTHVARDFVELPSQIMENWCYEEEALRLFATHYQTGEPLPMEWVEQIKKAAHFMEGILTVRQLDFAFIDMSWHTPKYNDEFRTAKNVEHSVGVLGNVVTIPKERCISTSFSHIFSGGYAAGYYSYKWSEVLDADAFEAFKEKGIFNTETAERFRNEILSKGGSDKEMTLYKNFRGKEPSLEPLLKRLIN